ncbi:MAG TPA: glutaredoxin family protein [Pyrinomonadaceae bacterium]|nr:glutaredoxin family protein [Pyrinomonadaceae bacterium]
MREKLRVVLYTKPDCGLCNEMKAAMNSAGCDELYTLEEVDIEQDPGTFELYRYEIPVLCINGVEAFRHQLAADDFKAYVTSLFVSS